MQHVLITNKSKAAVVGTKIAVADSFLSRLMGLMGRRRLEPGTGLLIAPSSGVHTCWMLMKIDVVALDRSSRVVKLGRAVKPWRLSCLGLKVHRIVELPAGRINECWIEIGDVLVITSA